MRVLSLIGTALAVLGAGGCALPSGTLVASPAPIYAPPPPPVAYYGPPPGYGPPPVRCFVRPTVFGPERICRSDYY